ncbi:hypothetical protein [Actinophytocola oryzae]|uniref:CU044_5270 family protein n=1 Tax=Actinophytocola oryzae TaxID=502181 RepID=A0A4R7VAR1_9PSEU|nr:hypothetical protein [Actinophytocola oryzae]TDV46082.1 hypothetical protein CLV71_11140 [Actinophytocola oryzae]
MTDPIDELLAGLRTDVPEMSEEAFDAGRTRLATHIDAPVPVVATEPYISVTPLRKKRLLRSLPRRLVASAAAAVALAAAVPVVQAARTDGAAPVATAAAQLNAAADRINPVDEPIRPGQFRYTITHRWALGEVMQEYERGNCQLPPGKGGPVVRLDDDDAKLRPCKKLPGGDLRLLQETTTEHWVPADLTQNCLWRNTTTGRYRWLVGDDERGRAVGFPMPRRESSEYAPPGCTDGARWLSGRLSPAFVAALPRDPRQLHDLLRRENLMTLPHPDKAFLDNVDLALDSGFASADLRAALYRALALMPGLRITEQFANLDGKKGTAFGLSRDGIRTDLIIDPATGQFIGMREITETDSSGLPRGSVVNYSSVANPVVVDRVRATH